MGHLENTTLKLQYRQWFWNEDGPRAITKLLKKEDGWVSSKYFILLGINPKIIDLFV